MKQGYSKYDGSLLQIKANIDIDLWTLTDLE